MKWGVTRLEVCPRTKAVCANTSEVTGSFYVAPPADPSIDHTTLESKPSADEVIYLDFNGEVVSGTQWNHFFNAWEDITVAASGLNRNEIIAAWERVAEDFSTFYVNVTTRRSVYNAAGGESRCMAVCTPTKNWMDDAKGGIATIDSYNNIWVSATCWVWNVDNYIACAETISHEVGHCMGNSHAVWESFDEETEVEYYKGHQTGCGNWWAPIMGWSADNIDADLLTQFTNEGSFKGQTNDEDQLDEIAYELGRRFDDQFEAAYLPLVLTNGKATVKGLLEHANDLDSWLILIPDAKWRVSVEPNPCGPNIDLKMAVRVGLNGTLKSYNNETNAKFMLSAEHVFPEAGTYRVTVSSDACLGGNGYDAYGGVGTYTLRVRPPIGFESDPPVLAGSQIKNLTLGSQGAIVEISFTDDNKILPTFFNSILLQRVNGGVSLQGQPFGEPVFEPYGEKW